ncbi:hypothetical protein Rsub_05107 [Raphidocelis subcapitata]|uniref:Serine/threonine-protein kinase TOR n=1 Tax=Raphidocelis subcapitata TaxID=307507 RepID=A0A2V0NYM0_9CHLO|nr:hypothetical protein Rsub_05107 [Raphidocelis subcapitata]|eukprot:GBF92738.1 hypothetical protein Rsub_05107 [Raphidocelis subcapitata]
MLAASAATPPAAAAAPRRAPARAPAAARAPRRARPAAAVPPRPSPALAPAAAPEAPPSPGSDSDVTPFSSSDDLVIPGASAPPEVLAARAKLKIFCYSAQPYVVRYLVNPLRGAGFGQLHHTEARLDAETAKIAQGYDAVCLFVNDTCDKKVIKNLAKAGVKFIAMRCAGYDRVDVAAANEAGIKVARVPTYSPTSVAEHAVALMFTIDRHIALAYNRVSQGNYSLSGLVGRQLGGKTVMPLVIEAIQDATSSRKRLVAVRTLGQIVGSAGCVMGPYLDFPQLLALLLRLLHEGGPAARREVMRVLGTIGALDPHTHKVNQASLSGEGKLELEGVRPLRHTAPIGSLVAGTPGAGGAAPGGTADGDPGADLLPSSGLLTSSEDYYPTVAINALMRVLRDPSLGSQHAAVVASLSAIFKALGTGSVPYLPKVLPVLLAVARGADEPLREYVLEQLTQLVRCVRQHIRRFLPELLALLQEFWGCSPRITHHCLALLAELALSLRDDLRPHVPELLPRFVGMLVDAERSGVYEMVRPALGALEALGSALEDLLHLLLPALMRLVSPAVSGPPLDVRRAVLRSLKRLLPRMRLAGYSSALLHPLIKVLDGPHEELRRDTLDTMCSLAVALGQDFNIFIPTIAKVAARHRLSHERFERLAARLLGAEPPCMSDAEDWEGAGGWAPEIDALAEQAALQAPTPPMDPGAQGQVKLSGQISMLRKAWESSARVTKDDWAEWMRHFSVELLAQSPSPALRACHGLAQVHPQMARELFAAGFVSCWAELDPASQEQLVRSLEAALAAPTIPPEIVTALLNLAEFMEHDDKRLPLDTRTLGALAEKCHAFAKALHYKEMEFQTSPATAIEALIHINNQLRQPEAAVGVLTYAQKHLAMELKEGWYEKLCRWDEALDAYQRRLAREPPGSQEYQVALLGKMRCLASLAEWQKLSALCRIEWRRSEPHLRKEMALLAAHAAWHMHEWDEMALYVETVDAPASHASRGAAGNGGPAGGAAAAMAAAAAAAAGGGAAATAGGGGHTATGAFLRAVLSVRAAQYDAAQAHIERARELMSTDLAALVGESYERAYTDMVRVQQLTELEEVIAYTRAADSKSRALAAGAAAALAAGGGGGGGGGDGGGGGGAAGAAAATADSRMGFIRGLWRRRLAGVQRNVEVWQSLFSVRSLVVPMHEDVDGWLKFASLSRKSGRPRQAERMLVQLLRYDPRSVTTPHAPGYGAGSGAPAVMLAFVKHLWATGSRQESLSRLQDLVTEIASTPPSEPPMPFVKPDLTAAAAAVPAHLSHLPGGALKRWQERPKPQLHARAYLRLGLYQWHVHDSGLDGPTIARCLGLLKSATEYGANWAKAWHNWSLFNCGVLESLARAGEPEAAAQYVAPAVQGFFRSVALGQACGDRTGGLQDILRLLTLWFNWGSAPAVEEALQEGFGLVSIDTWLAVIPQIIARIHTNNVQVRGLINTLLVRIGRSHPQALMYPLLVACKSQSQARQAAAYAVLDMIRTHSATLVEQAQLVSQELIRIAILWHEEWHEALEEASRLYFGESNVEAMLAVLLPLHEKMERQGPTTLKEIAFVQAYGRELSEAYEWLSKYRASRKEAELHQAWDLYYHVFKRINKQLHALSTLELQYVAPALVRAQGMELAVPGTYIAGEPLVTIAAFAPQLAVISSKQRPRKLTIHGGDGAEYMFLLKGHEDLRQDERVMQLFGLVNSMLAADHATAERDLSIARYAVIPLSPNSGLIGWVPNCDTLHALIREYRDARKIPLNWEHRLMLSMAPDYDHLTVIQKVEVFEYALDSTSGEDLHRVLWLKSRNSEVWLDRRTTYTRSTAVMSMTGYLLGLGDRHPSNLMLDRYSGKLLHIDFGDCFEASMHRWGRRGSMEVSGIEGNFRSTCENVMRVLRLNKDSVMAMLEAFVHDPLINWRLLNAAEAATEAALAREDGGATAGGAGAAAAGAGAGAAAAGEPLGQQQAAAAGPGPGPGGGEPHPHHHTAADFADGAAGGAGGGADPPSPPQRGARERELREARDHLAGDASEVLNERAVAVMTRMSDKLMGRDAAVEGVPGPTESHSVPAQVQRLITQATSHENLAQSYVGWCPFW